MTSYFHAQSIGVWFRVLKFVFLQALLPLLKASETPTVYDNALGAAFRMLQHCDLTSFPIHQVGPWNCNP